MTQVEKWAPAQPAYQQAFHQVYLLRLADNALVLGQRNAEWCGNGPILEEDIALANISLDLVGQARLLYQHCANLQGDGATEDSLAYLRGPESFLNYTLVELPHSTGGNVAAGVGAGVGNVGAAAGQRDYAVTVVRNFLYSAHMLALWHWLQKSSDAQLSAIAERSVKETRYHLRHSRDWLVKLGDGTAQSHEKVQAALNFLMPYTAEFWYDTPIDVAASGDAVGILPSLLYAEWLSEVQNVVTEATLSLPPPEPLAEPVPCGKLGHHSPFLAPLLGEMQSLARQHPGAVW